MTWPNLEWSAHIGIGDVLMAFVAMLNVMVLVVVARLEYRMAQQAVLQRKVETDKAQRVAIEKGSLGLLLLWEELRLLTQEGGESTPAAGSSLYDLFIRENSFMVEDLSDLPPELLPHYAQAMRSALTIKSLVAREKSGETILNADFLKQAIPAMLDGIRAAYEKFSERIYSYQDEQIIRAREKLLLYVDGQELSPQQAEEVIQALMRADQVLGLDPVFTVAVAKPRDEGSR